MLAVLARGVRARGRPPRLISVHDLGLAPGQTTLLCVLEATALGAEEPPRQTDKTGSRHHRQADVATSDRTKPIFRHLRVLGGLTPPRTTPAAAARRFACSADALPVLGARSSQNVKT
jgi:hypothetical protein